MHVVLIVSADNDEGVLDTLLEKEAFLAVDIAFHAFYLRDGNDIFTVDTHEFSWVELFGKVGECHVDVV